MTLNEAIEHSIEIANSDCSECAKQHKQLAGWLKELKGRRKWSWIPTSERLPNKNEYCKNDGRFIVTDGNRVEQGLFDVYADGHHDPYWPYQSCNPIAWMEMPEKYKPE